MTTKLPRLVWRNFGTLADGNVRMYAMVPTFYALAISRGDSIALAIITGVSKKETRLFSCKTMPQAKRFARQTYLRWISTSQKTIAVENHHGTHADHTD